MVLEQFQRKLAARLWALREESAYTQKQVGLLSGLALQHYQKLEAGQANPTVKTLIKVAGAYRMSLGELLSFI
jgi:transcriptional regulator with XRE-family HTH domain